MIAYGDVVIKDNMCYYLDGIRLQVKLTRWGYNDDGPLIACIGTKRFRQAGDGSWPKLSELTRTLADHTKMYGAELEKKRQVEEDHIALVPIIRQLAPLLNGKASLSINPEGKAILKMVFDASEVERLTNAVNAIGSV